LVVVFKVDGVETCHYAPVLPFLYI